jgi:hypothetical protein
MPVEERIGLDNQERLFPSLGRPCEYNQEQPILPGTCWTLHLTANNDQLLTEKRVFASSSALVRVRSVSVPANSEWQVGRVHRCKR